MIPKPDIVTDGIRKGILYQYLSLHFRAFWALSPLLGYSQSALNAARPSHPHHPLVCRNARQARARGMRTGAAMDM